MLPFEESSETEALPFEQGDSSSDAKQELKKMKTYAGTILEKPVAVGEAGMSMLAGLPAQIYGGLTGLSKGIMAPGDIGKKLDVAQKQIEDAAKWNFGFGEYRPMTETGQRYSENVQNAFAKPGELAGDAGAYIGKALGNEELGRLSGKLPVDTAMNFLPLHLAIKAPANAVKARMNAIEARNKAAMDKPVEKAAEAVGAAPEVLPFEQGIPDNAGASAFQNIADSQLNGWKQDIPARVDPMQQAADTLSKVGDQQRQAAAQAAIDARLKQQEFEVQKQGNLDRMAADRQRLEQQSTGYQDYLDQNRQQFDQAAAPIADQLNQLQGALDEGTRSRLLEQQQSEALQRAQEAQRVIDERNAQQDFEVKRKANLDRQAAERARLSNQPTGYSDWVEQMRNETRIPGNNSPLEFTKHSTFNPELKDYTKVDSIPFEDLSAAYGIEKATQIKEAWENYKVEQFARDTATRRQHEMQDVRFDRQARREDALMPLEEQLRRDAYKPVDETQGPKTRQFNKDRWNNPERGAINLEALQDGYSQLKELANGVRLAYFGDKTRPNVTAFDKDGKVIGNLDMSPTDFVGDPKATDNMMAMWVDSQVPGTAAEMYRFAAEQGHDIIPSKVQTAGGKAMWNRFEKEGLANKGMIKGQRGGIDVTAVSDAIKSGMKELGKATEAIRNFDIRRAAGSDKQDYVSKIPGMGNVADGIIPKPENADVIIDKALQAGDTPNIWTNINPGPEMAGWKYKNPLLSGTSQWLQWADKKTEYAVRTMVRPLERAINQTGNKGMIDLANVLKTEMFSGERMSPEQLKEAGLNPTQIRNYNELRRSFDSVYDLQAESLRAQGKRVPSKQEAYLASVRGGNYHVNVKDTQGRTAWHIQARSQFEANKAIKWLQENVPDINKDMKVEYRKPNRLPGVPTDLLGGYQELMRLVDPEAELVVKEAIRRAQEEAGYNYAGQSNRFLNKANVRGFEGDMPWLSERENAHRLLQNQVDYLHNAYEWTYTNEALSQVKNILSDERVVNQLPNATDYITEVVRNQLGLADNLAKNAEEAVMSKLGLSRSHLSKTTGGIGNMTSLLQLGGSVGYAIATPITALYSVATHLREGTLGKQAVLGGLADGVGSLINLSMEPVTGKRVPMTELGAEALKYAEDNGIVTKDMFGDLDRIGSNPLTKGVKKSLTWTIQAPERIQRVMTFMAFVHGLKERGMTNNMDIFRRAETLTNISATNFRASEMPMGVSKAGVVGSAAFKYKAPMLNYWNQLHTYARDAATGGSTKPLMGLLGMTAVLGGLQNLPGVNEVDGAWNLVKDAVAKFSPENYGKVQDVDVKDFIRQNAGDAAAYGAVQELLGAQMSQRFGTDLANVEDPLKNMFPALSMAGNVASTVGDLASGNFSQAAWNMSPQVGRGNIEVRNNDFRGLQPGSFRKPSDINNPDIQQIRTAKDEEYRKFGLRSGDEARRLESTAKVNQEQKRINSALVGSMEKLVNAATKGDQEGIQKYAKAWLGMNPDTQAFESALQAKLSSAALSQEQRELAKAKTYMQVQKILKLQNARN